MNYILKQFDNDLLYFSMENTINGLTVQIQSVNKEKKYLLPLDLDLTNESLVRC